MVAVLPWLRSPGEKQRVVADVHEVLASSWGHCVHYLEPDVPAQ